MTTDTRRLAREMEHHRRITPDAEVIWNWGSPAGILRADRRAAFFVEHARLSPGRCALELGCGTGVFLRRVATSGASITGVDLSVDLLEQARSNTREYANVRLELGNAEQLPHTDASFDAVYGSSILHHLDLDRALAEAFRVLRPGGLTVFTEPNLWNPQIAFSFGFRPTRHWFGLSPDEMAFTRARAESALQRAGFRDIRVTCFDFLHPSTPARWIASVQALGQRLESTPGVRGIAGSLLLRGTRP